MSSNSGQTVFDLGIEDIGPAVRLGSGGSANVYAVQQQSTGRRLAVKVLKASADTERMRKRFEREQEVLTRVSLDPGIVPIVGSGNTARGEPYILMPLMAGSLQDRLDVEGALDWQTAAHLCIQISETVQRAHDHQVLHRDLKPANILVDDHGTTRLADFGISKLTDGTISRSSHTVGTPAYMAPEHFQGEEPDVRTDVYGLGATFSALVVGRAPFTTGDNDHSAAIMHRVLHDDPPDLGRSGVPPEVAMLARRAMAKDRAERCDSAQAFASGLRGALGAHSSLDPDEALSITLYDIDPTRMARSQALPRTSGDDDRRRRLVPLLVGSLVVLGLLAGGAWALLGNDDDGGTDTEVAGTDVTSPAGVTDGSPGSDSEDSSGSQVLASGSSAQPPDTLTEVDNGGVASEDVEGGATTSEPQEFQPDVTEGGTEAVPTGGPVTPGDTGPRFTDPPVVGPPVVDSPSTEPPVVEPPVVDSPSTEPPVVEPPVVDSPSTEPPVVDPPVVDPPAVLEAPTGVTVVNLGQSRPGNQDVRVSWSHEGPAPDGFIVQRSRLGANPPPWPEDGGLLDADARSVDLINKLAIGGHRYDILVEAVRGDEVVQSFSVAFSTMEEDGAEFLDDGGGGGPIIVDEQFQAPTGVSVISTGQSRAGNEDVMVTWSHSGPVDGFRIERRRSPLGPPPPPPIFPEDGSLIDADARSIELTNKLQTGPLTYDVWVVAYLGDDEAASATASFTTTAD